VFGEWIDQLRYFRLAETELDGIPLVISRTGWSSELGYEIYLRDGSRGDELWERLMDAGGQMGLGPGHTSTIRRIEGGMLSYIADMDTSVNPYELGLDRLVDVDMDAGRPVVAGRWRHLNFLPVGVGQRAERGGGEGGREGGGEGGCI
jgi:aminomethyltransferase